MQNQLETPAYIRYGMRILTIISGISCICLGIFVMISVSATCIVAGLLNLVIGAFILVMEAPFCCAFIPQTGRISDFRQKLGYLPMGILYAIFGLLPLCLCFGISSVFCALGVLACAGLNFFLFFKARRQKNLGEALPTDASMGAQNIPPAYSDAPPPYAPYTQDIMGRAAAGAARGAVAGMVDSKAPPQSGGYPGF